MSVKDADMVMRDDSFGKRLTQYSRTVSKRFRSTYEESDFEQEVVARIYEKSEGREIENPPAYFNRMLYTQFQEHMGDRKNKWNENNLRFSYEDEIIHRTESRDYRDVEDRIACDQIQARLTGYARIVFVRLRRGEKQVDIARATGKSPSYVSKTINNHIKPEIAYATGK